jgi:hypothetical protein
MTLLAPVGKVIIGASGAAQSRMLNTSIPRELFQDDLATGFEALENEFASSSATGAFPNPFREQTQVSYFLEKESPVEIQVYNLIGSPVARLVSEVQTAGAHQISWQGTDGQGRVLPKGMYIIRIKTGELVSNLKVLKE